MITESEHVSKMIHLVQETFPNAIKTYSVAGTLKFELPAREASLSNVFHFMEVISQKIKVIRSSLYHYIELCVVGTGLGCGKCELGRSLYQDRKGSRCQINRITLNNEFRTWESEPMGSSKHGFKLIQF